jgi:uncharacterized RDD family membrane protein YckC
MYALASKKRRREDSMSIIPPEPQPTPAFAPSFGGYVSTPEALPGVGFAPRLLARLIDLALHYGIAFGSGILFVVFLVIASGGRVDPVLLRRLKPTTASAFILALLGSVAYEIVCETMHGSTLGKMLLSMVVVQEDGSPCRFKSAVIRSFAYFIDGLFFGLVGYLEMNKSFQEQRHGDVWAHTVVCKRKSVPQASLRGGGQFLMAFLLACCADSALLMFSLLIKLV